MTLADRVIDFQRESLQNMIEDPYHYPIGAHFVPFATIAFFFYLSSEAFQFVASGRAVLNLIPYIGIEIGVLVFAVGTYFVGVRAYDWRMAFADRHPKLHRLAQLWRIALGLLALAVVWYAYTGAGVTMPTTVYGTLPTWVFALFTFGLFALISIGVRSRSRFTVSLPARGRAR